MATPASPVGPTKGHQSPVGPSQDHSVPSRPLAQPLPDGPFEDRPTSAMQLTPEETTMDTGEWQTVSWKRRGSGSSAGSGRAHRRDSVAEQSVAADLPIGLSACRR